MYMYIYSHVTVIIQDLHLCAFYTYSAGMSSLNDRNTVTFASQFEGGKLLTHRRDRISCTRDSLSDPKTKLYAASTSRMYLTIASPLRTSVPC